MKKGFALIEMLVGVFILVTVGLAIAGAFVSAVKSVTYAKTVIAATALANEEMETLHNLPYDSLATEKSETIIPLPPVLLPAKKPVDIENFSFDVYTVIESYDDPFDGLKPADTAPFDYKKVSISITLKDKPTKFATLATNIGAKAAETKPTTGVLMICAIDSHGNPVGLATVTVNNSYVSPAVIDKIVLTGVITGCVMIPNLPPDLHNHYHIKVTKGDTFSADWTYGDQANQNPHALKPDMNVPTQGVETGYFVIDELAQMNLQFVDASGTPVPNVTFTLTGEKMISDTPNDYKYSHDPFTTDEAGKITISGLEFDNYSFSNISSNYLIATTPMYPIALAAAADLTVTATLSTSATNPAIYSVDITNGQVGETVSLTIAGDKFKPGATANLNRIISGNRVQIDGVNTTRPSDTVITTDFPLLGAAVGKWNLEIINPDGEKVDANNIFEVTN